MKIKDLLGPIEKDKKHRKFRKKLKQLTNLSGVDEAEILLVPHLRVWGHLDDEEQINLIRWIYGDIDLYKAKNLEYKLYEFYQEDMPYGTQKARTGDPNEWIYAKLESELEHIRKQIEHGNPRFQESR